MSGKKLKSYLNPFLWAVAAFASGGLILAFGYYSDLILHMTLLAAVLFAVLFYQASPKYCGALLWLTYTGFAACRLFAVGFLSDSSVLMTFLTSFLFGIGLHNADLKLSTSLDKGVAFKRGVLAGLVFLALGHGLAYFEFRDRACVWLDRDRPGYLDLDWPNSDCDKAVDALLQYASGERNPNKFWTYLRLRAEGGFEASTFSSKLSRKQYRFSWAGVWSWVWIAVQAGLTLFITGFAVFMGAIKRDKSLDLPTEPAKSPEGEIKVEGTVVPGRETKLDPRDNVFAEVREALRNKRPAYIVVIQRFRPGGGYTLVGWTPDRKSACQKLSGTGQRHPGFVIRCVKANDMAQQTAPPRAKPLGQLALQIDSPLLLIHSPIVTYENLLGNMIEVTDAHRFEVTWAGDPKQDRGEAKKLLEKLPCAALLGVVIHIADSEGGTYSRYYQDGLNTIGRGE